MDPFSWAFLDLSRWVSSKMAASGDPDFIGAGITVEISWKSLCPSQYSSSSCSTFVIQWVEFSF